MSKYMCFILFMHTSAWFDTLRFHALRRTGEVLRKLERPPRAAAWRWSISLVKNGGIVVTSFGIPWKIMVILGVIYGVPMVFHTYGNIYIYGISYLGLCDRFMVSPLVFCMGCCSYGQFMLRKMRYIPHN